MSSTAFQQVPRGGLLPRLLCTQDTQATPRGTADPQPFPSLHPQSCSGVEFSLVPPKTHRGWFAAGVHSCFTFGY